MRLLEIRPDDYAQAVLPLTATLWAGRRDYERYVAQTTEIANSRYGRRHYRTVGYYDGKKLVASCKRYERTLRIGSKRLAGIGFGAVFTPPEFRGRGYASSLIGSVLDQAKRDGYDFGYLFSDIRPAFYQDIGFTPLSSRSFSLRSDTLAKQRIEVTRLEDGDWAGVRRCFDLGESARPWGFTRTPLVWEWVRLRMEHGSEHTIGTLTNLVVRRGRGIAAYVMGVRAPEHDAYILDEFGFADDTAAALIPALLRSAAGDLRRVVGWLPPTGARELLPKGAVRKRKDATFMVAPLTPIARAWLADATTPSPADTIWSTDHI